MLKLLNKVQSSLSQKMASEHGHTLMSTALGIVGVGMMVGVGANLFNVHQQLSEQAANGEAMMDVREAMNDFFDLHGTLPCPAPITAGIQDAEFGRSVGGDSGCDTGDFAGVSRVEGANGQEVLIGSIPTRTMNLPDSMAIDEFGGRFMFAVTASFTDGTSSGSAVDSLLSGAPAGLGETAFSTGSAFGDSAFANTGNTTSNSTQTTSTAFSSTDTSSAQGTIAFLDESGETATTDADSAVAGLILGGSDSSAPAPQGGITILDNNGQSATSSPGNGVFLVMSPGADQRGAFDINGNSILPCDPSTVSGGNCDMNDAVFTVASMDFSGFTFVSSEPEPDDFTDSFFYTATPDVFEWRVEFQEECTCPTKTRDVLRIFCVKIPGGFGGTDETGSLIGGGDVEPIEVDDSFCPTPRPTPDPIDCSADPVVNNCFGFEVPEAVCPSPITETITVIGADPICLGRADNGNGESFPLSDVLALNGTNSCLSEGDALPENDTIVCEPPPPEVTGGGDGGGGDGSDGGDPLALDLNGDGEIGFTSIEDGILFDIDNDGIVDQASSIGTQDGLLALDRDGNGIIDNQSELFGYDGVLAFDHLAEYDSNNDGAINELDDVFEDLLVFQDANGDGISQASELKSLTDHSISEIGLGHNELDDNIEGNRITGAGVFTQIVEGVGEVMNTIVEFFFDFISGAESSQTS